ncbi:MAG: formylglycine-generating enzyme family protein [Lewinellaceae bacterium]|nr:formylglycine-generating enzyme family protein [Saprospiraceae bacterium]MCB9330121.1 formylglycine-generating enzyme family protein [Lewinellaceae bacterium]
MEGTPADILAAEALNSCKQIEQAYGKVDRILQIIEVENLEISRYDANRTLTVYRTPSRIWAYPMPQNDNSFKLAVFVQFRITGQQAPAGDPGMAAQPAARLPFEPEMVLVEGGTFTMGCTAEQGDDCDFDEKPAHRVTLNTFYMAKTEVTQAQWRAVMGSDPPNLYFKGCDQCPVENVSWNDAQDFLKKLNAKTGRKYRLPTEAEWEYAARGGNKSKGYKYAGSNSLDEVGWHRGNAGGKTNPAGQKKANELGLYDMSGNVFEWCNDWYVEAYPAAAQTDPPEPASGTHRVFRGGAWRFDSGNCRVADRVRGISYGYEYLGFRVAQDY